MIERFDEGSSIRLTPAGGGLTLVLPFAPRRPRPFASPLPSTILAVPGPEDGDAPTPRPLHRESRAAPRPAKVLESLEDPSARFVLTIHSKPKAVLIGAEAFLALLRGHTPEDRLLALQLGALVQGLEASHFRPTT